METRVKWRAQIEVRHRALILFCTCVFLNPFAIPASGQQQKSAPRPTPNAEHVAILKQGVGVWNKWRADNPAIVPDLSGADLADLDLSDVDIRELDLGRVTVEVGSGIARTDFSGALLVAVDLRRADLIGADLRGANLQAADLREANLFLSLLVGTRLNTANLTRANLNEANLRDASLSGANLSSTGLMQADLSGTLLNGVDLSNSDLHHANLKGAIMTGAMLLDAELLGAEMSGAILNKADLTGAVLTGVKFERADLRYSRLDNSIFDPETVPTARNLIGASGLKTLKLIGQQVDTGVMAYDIGAIVELRESARNAGLRDMERELTCSVERIRNWNPNREWYVRILSWIFFELTCAYGAAPARPLWLLSGSIVICSLFYALLFYWRPESTIYIDDMPNDGSALRSIKVGRLALHSGLGLRRRARVFWQSAGTIQRAGISNIARIGYRITSKILRIVGVLRFGLYFSLQSAFNIGYREFNIGNWLSRLQYRPYTLGALGPLRAVSGFQSLIGVYLLAMWILCTFGRPFG